MNFIGEIRQLARRFDQEGEAAYDLWSWLPSKEITEKYHGDYHSEFCPEPAYVMREACIVFCSQQFPKLAKQDEGDWKEYCGRCCCGENCQERYTEFEKGSLVVAFGAGVKWWLRTWEGQQGKVICEDVDSSQVPTEQIYSNARDAVDNYAQATLEDAIENDDIRILCFPHREDISRLPSQRFVEAANYVVFCPKDKESPVVFLKNR